MCTYYYLKKYCQKNLVWNCCRLKSLHIVQARHQSSNLNIDIDIIE